MIGVRADGRAELVDSSTPAPCSRTANSSNDPPAVRSCAGGGGTTPHPLPRRVTQVSHNLGGPLTLAGQNATADGASSARHLRRSSTSRREKVAYGTTAPSVGRAAQDSRPHSRTACLPARCRALHGGALGSRATEPSPWCRPKLARVLAISVDELHGLLGKDETIKATRPGARSRLADEPLSGDAADERLDEIATVPGLTTGRIRQLKSTASAAQRAFFGIRPVTVAIPLRVGVAQRKRIVIAAEDSATVDQLETVLADYALASSRVTIAPETTEPPAGDAIVVCGPKSAPVGAWLLDRDPRLGMVEENGVWSVLDRMTGQRHHHRGMARASRAAISPTSPGTSSTVG